MAEERLIDADKDKKYRIRKNADGEDELYLASDEEEEDEQLPVFSFEFAEEDDEEAAVLTPEQYAERERLKAEARAEAERKTAELLSVAAEKLSKNDYDGAYNAAVQAEGLVSGNGLAYALKLRALTKDLTDFSELDKCVETAENVKEYSSAEQKEELNGLASSLKARIDETSSRCNELEEANQRGKAERREAFARQSSKWLKLLIGVAVPFIALLTCAIVFSTMMFAAENGLFLILTIVFGALTIVALLVLLFPANRYWTAKRKLKLNEKDSSTQTGREYKQTKAELDGLTEIYNSFSE